MSNLCNTVQQVISQVNAIAISVWQIGKYYVDLAARDIIFLSEECFAYNFSVGDS